MHSAQERISTSLEAEMSNIVGNTSRDRMSCSKEEARERLVNQRIIWGFSIV